MLKSGRLRARMALGAVLAEVTEPWTCHLNESDYALRAPLEHPKHCYTAIELFCLDLLYHVRYPYSREHQLPGVPSALQLRSPALTIVWHFQQVDKHPPDSGRRHAAGGNRSIQLTWWARRVARAISTAGQDQFLS